MDEKQARRLFEHADEWAITLPDTVRGGRVLAAELDAARAHVAAVREEVGAIADQIWAASTEGAVLDLVGKLRAVAKADR